MTHETVILAAFTKSLLLDKTSQPSKEFQIEVAKVVFGESIERFTNHLGPVDIQSF